MICINFYCFTSKTSKWSFIKGKDQLRSELFLRIWEQIINKSVDNLKKTEIELLIEEQKAQKEKLTNIESTLKAIENSLSNTR